ncbi:hypothetical protein MGI18_06140 [Bacillus sp. OVS6]|nr:hypothetical protein MGI18_06140 [Bacillus sp. OVS6]
MHVLYRNAEPTDQLRQADKDPTEKALFAFTGGAVLTEELGGEAGQQKCGTARLAPTGR